MTASTKSGYGSCVVPKHPAAVTRVDTSSLSLQRSAVVAHACDIGVGQIGAREISPVERGLKKDGAFKGGKSEACALQVGAVEMGPS